MSFLASARVRSKRVELHPFTRRVYHDKSFGYRERPPYVFPEYTRIQLKNRSDNAPLLRFVDSMRTHGHRAARIDPLDLIRREEVAALSAERYGLVDEDKSYNVNGILWTMRVGEYQEGEGEEWWTLKEIKEHLRRVYVGNVAYEFMHSPSKTERLWFSHLLESQTLPFPEDTPLVHLDEALKKRIHGLLSRSEVFDNFLRAKFPNAKHVRIIITLDTPDEQSHLENVELPDMRHRGDTM